MTGGARLGGAQRDAVVPHDGQYAVVSQCAALPEILDDVLHRAMTGGAMLRRTGSWGEGGMRPRGKAAH